MLGRVWRVRVRVRLWCRLCGPFIRVYDFVVTYCWTTDLVQ